MKVVRCFPPIDVVPGPIGSHLPVLEYRFCIFCSLNTFLALLNAFVSLIAALALGDGRW